MTGTGGGWAGDAPQPVEVGDFRLMMALNEKLKRRFPQQHIVLFNRPRLLPMAPKGGDDKKRILMFNVSGFIGTVLFFYFYEFVVEALSSALVPGTFLANYKVTIAWTFSNLVSILWQHSLHRYLVYGHSKPYFQSLVGTYAAYSVSIVLSHFAMMGLEYEN